jgi:hypothetical protein
VTKTLKPIDNVSPGEAASHWAVTKVNANVASKNGLNRGPSPQPRGEGNMGSRNLNDTVTSPRRGGMRQHGDKDMLSNWRSPPRPIEKSAEQGRSYNR